MKRTNFQTNMIIWPFEHLDVCKTFAFSVVPSSSVIASKTSCWSKCWAHVLIYVRTLSVPAYYCWCMVSNVSPGPGMSRASRVNIKHMPLQLLGIIFSVQFPARHWPLPRAKCLSAYCYIYIQHFVWPININTILLMLWIKEKFFNQRLFRLSDKSILQVIISAISLYFILIFVKCPSSQNLVRALNL